MTIASEATEEKFWNKERIAKVIAKSIAFVQGKSTPAFHGVLAHTYDPLTGTPFHFKSAHFKRLNTAMAERFRISPMTPQEMQAVRRAHPDGVTQANLQTLFLERLREFKPGEVTA